MNLKHLFVAVPATLFILGNGAANAGQTINEAGAAPPPKEKPQEPTILQCGAGGSVVYSEGFSVLKWAEEKARRKRLEHI